MFVPSSWGIFVYKPEKSIDTRIVQSFRLDFSLWYPMSWDQFSIFGFDHVVEVFGRSCLTNIVMFSGPWTNTSKLATWMGSFFGQAQAVNTNYVWSWRRHDRKCRRKRRTSTRVKPSESDKVVGGKGLVHRTVGFLFSCKWNHGGSNEGHTFNKSFSRILPACEEFSGPNAAKGWRHYVYCHRGADVEATQTWKSSDSWRPLTFFRETAADFANPLCRLSPLSCINSEFLCR